MKGLRKLEGGQGAVHMVKWQGSWGDPALEPKWNDESMKCNKLKGPICLIKTKLAFCRNANLPHKFVICARQVMAITITTTATNNRI